MKIKVAVGMSGGVDSSTSALLLKEKGYEVIGLFMKNWDDDEDEFCPAAKDYEDALIVAEKLKIPLYAFNFSKEYWDLVFTHFLEELQAGRTPNPDILCNREIKFKVFLEKALELGADFLATGHYAGIGPGYELLKGKDPGKDQSYFLYTLKQDLLKKILFPIGELHKSEVRKLAQDAGFLNFDKKDSTGICFIGKRKFKNFIQQYMPPTQGFFKTPDGKIVGTHTGAWYYTIGQRKGMGIGGEGDGWYVVSKNINTHEVTVSQDESLLFSDTLQASNLTWVGSKPQLSFCCTAKIRYRHQDVPCIIEHISSGTASIRFSKPERAITPGQSIVFYQGNICLGGGVIL